MKTILFQGDSITDAGRSKDHDGSIGVGYPNLVTAALGYDDPYAYRFYNRGISGNRIVDVYARIKKDIINLKPDVMSLLIGINDVWHEVNQKNGVDAEKFYKVYAMLIEEIQEALPDIKIMILEPFVLMGTATTEAFDYFKSETAKRAEKAKAIAEAYGLAFVPLQKAFDEASKKTKDSAYWLTDGVHPTPMGHELIKRAWLSAFKSL